jgi:hypothetical protein
LGAVAEIVEAPSPIVLWGTILISNFKRIFGARSESSDTEIAVLIENFVNGTSDKWAWDDFISSQYSNERTEAARIECLRVAHDFPGALRSGAAKRA